MAAKMTEFDTDEPDIIRLARALESFNKKYAKPKRTVRLKRALHKFAFLF